jgi:putative thioredoxin
MDFQKDVIERSREIPVLVDFWAEWCGPCRMLTPVLEAVEKDQKGRWELVKVNTEENQDLAARYQVRSIPNVKLFHGGEVVDEFVGALSKPMLERWLDDHLPDPSSLQLMALLDRAAGWPDPTLVEPLETFVLEHPQRNDGKLALARFSVTTNPAAAKALAEEVPQGDKYYDGARDIIALAELLDGPNDGAPAGPLLEAGKQALQQADVETALKRLVEAVSKDKNYREALPRRATVALFRMLGEHHPLTQTYRRKFSMALH